MTSRIESSLLHGFSEQTMHRVRWWIAIAWSLLIASLFYDPVTAYLTEPTTVFSPLRLIPEGISDPAQCVQVQGVCLSETPYSLGARIFWAMVVPSGLLIIFVLGHEFWRRICPLSFFSQIPRALGIQRKRKRVISSGKTRDELVSIDKKSWLGRNFLLLQFGFLVLGLVFRLLFVNSDRWALGVFLILTILAAILVGYLYAGKSWCQYFCPMAPVQMVFTGPRGVLGTQAHWGQTQKITQSMCQEVDAKTGQEKSACVGCQSPCIDIDAERAYWDRVGQGDRRFVHYGYIGLVLGFYFYFFLYSGNWKYYYSGAWTHEENQLASVLSPGFYLWGQPIPIPKLIAVPLTLVLFVGAAYWLISLAETAYRHRLERQGISLDNELILHRVFTLCTFFVWNLFWIFGSRPSLALLPEWAERGFTGFIVLVSGLWFYQTFWRTSEQYSREGLVNTLRRQLDKQGFDVAKFLNRTNNELKPDEVYVLAKVLPNVNQTQKLVVYKGVLQGALKDGIVTSAESALLQELQTGLDISKNEHYSVLTSLGIEDPSLFDPTKQISLENQLRLDSYRQSIESLVQDHVGNSTSARKELEYRSDRITKLRLDYRITDKENEQILNAVFGNAGGVLKNAEAFIQQFQVMAVRYLTLQTEPTNPEAPVYTLLRVAISDRQKMILHQLLAILEMLQSNPEAHTLAQKVHSVAHTLLPAVLHPNEQGERSWQAKLDPQVFALLDANAEGTGPALTPSRLSGVLGAILHEEFEPLVRALSLNGLHQVDPSMATRAATELMKTSQPFLLQEVVQTILVPVAANPLNQVPRHMTTLDKIFSLSESRFFNQLSLEMLIDVAMSCQSRSYERGEVICQMGDCSQEVLIVFEGEADVQINRTDGSTKVINTITQGETVGELGVLTKTPRSATVIATSDPTWVLVLDAQRLESLLKRSPALAIGLLVIISKRLQKLLRDS